jgi:hypothetical protein
MVTFHHPPTGTNNPLRDFQPNNQNHYPGNVPGIYIYGIRTKVDGDLKFVPLVVGETGKLQNRLYKEHYLRKYFNPLRNLVVHPGNSTCDPKEIWNFSRKYYLMQEIQNIYGQILIFDNLPVRNINNQRVNGAVPLDQLLFYQQGNFFDIKHTGNVVANRSLNIQTYESIAYLTRLAGNPNADFVDVTQHMGKLMLTLANFSKNFYFVYADAIYSEPEHPLDLSVAADRRAIEKKIKQTIGQELNIHTSASARGVPANIQIDLSRIQNDLVNIGGHNHVDPNGAGGYINPLIL